MQTLVISDPEPATDGRMKHGEVEQAKQLGTVRIECKHSEALHHDKSPSRQQIEDTSIVSEKALKGRAISHGVE